MKLTCMNCGHNFVGDVSYDALGWHSVCPKCGSSFDVDADCVTLKFLGIVSYHLEPDHSLSIFAGDKTIASISDGVCEESFVDEVLSSMGYVWMRDGMLAKPVSAASEKREFIVETPLGKLKAYAKHESDDPANFPGVFVDLVREGEEDEMLACVEYESCGGEIQTCAYNIGEAAPAVIHVHEMPEKEPNKVRFGVSWMCYAKQEIELPDEIDPNDEDAVRDYIESVWEDIPLPGNSDAYVNGSDSLDVDAPLEIVKG